MHEMSPEMRACVEQCLRYHSACLGAAMSHCPEQGGEHVEPERFRLMIACAEICQTSANFMLIGTSHYKHMCRECAEICIECAKSCEQIGGMEECVDACRQCAESCRRMAA